MQQYAALHLGLHCKCTHLGVSSIQRVNDEYMWQIKCAHFSVFNAITLYSIVMLFDAFEILCI